MSAVSLPSAAACARSDSLDLSNSSNEAIPNSDIEVASSLGGTSDREFSIGESWRTVDDGSSRDSQSRPDDRVPALTPRTLIESNSPATTANGTVVAESVTDVFAEAVPTALIPEEKHPDKPEAEKTGAELPLRPRKRWRPRRRQPPVSSSRTAAGVPESAALTMPNSAASCVRVTGAADGFGASVSGFGGRRQAATSHGHQRGAAAAKPPVGFQQLAQQLRLRRDSGRPGRQQNSLDLPAQRQSNRCRFQSCRS
ncbi:hypothetical protein BOX15_Mlig020592g4 [Macrostomum lignano]|uniref:Uncharacterized protein n=1 Tax=Macrostomum lignano TaxID=282301 RepID=A0A267DSR6_9PLAT|nr:hypothetical protein BOX15_Mlig020592g4 [Macrostomum lignano]